MSPFRLYLLRRLLRRRPPKEISSSSPEWGKRNDIYVRGSTEEHEEALLLALDFRSGKVTYVWWPVENNQAESTEAECAADQVIWESLSVTQEYHAWRINYGSLYEAFIHDLLFLPQIRYLFNRVRSRLYEPLTPENRIAILEEVVKRYGSGEKVRFDALMVHMYGPSIRLSPEQHGHRERLKFILRSLEVTGDVRVRPENIGAGQDWVEWELHGDVIPEPKAIATLADYFESQRKHRDTIRLSGMQLVLGLGMLAIALVTLFIG